MQVSDINGLIDLLLPSIHAAGKVIIDVHARHRGDIDFMQKGDGSPVTEADLRANALLTAALESAAPDIPIISEEDAASHATTGTALTRFFLVDPLDGTKEFLKKDGRGAFTVNVALIENGQPVFGLVFAPALNRLFIGNVPEAAATETDAFGLNGRGILPLITVRPIPETGAVAVASASHRDAETDAWLHAKGITETVSIGSSLKFCLIAAGEADVYPRFGPTMEWDTAAGQAILMAAGGSVCHPDGSPFGYGKPDFRNGAFIAKGSF